MDDMEDDARYPSNPYHLQNPRGHLSSSSFARPKNPSSRIPPPSQISRRYPTAVGEEEDEDGPNGMSRPMDDDDDDEENDNEAGGYRRVDDDDDEDSSSGSSEGRGKRRRIDKHALGFEFAPRVPPQTTASPKTPARSSTTDWSDDATSVLLDAWGDRYVQNGRKSLRSDEWSEVAKIVSQASKIGRSDAQCRNRVDTLKKKYKKEKSRLAMDHSNSSSNWVHFERMDALMSPPTLPPPVTGRQRQHHQPPRLACGVDAGEYVFARSNVYHNHVNGNDEMRDSPGDTGTEDDGDDEEGDSDGLPPCREAALGSSNSSFKMLADSIQKFGEIYEKVENNKRQQMTELERMRKEFQRDLELQKKQILERSQAEIAKLREEEGDDGDDEDDDDDDDDNDNSGSAENLSRFIAGSSYLTVFG